MNGHVLLNIFIFLASACIMVPIASRFKLGSVLGYLLVGILIGPFGLKLIGNTQQIMDFGEFGVIMMLFLIGLELEPAMLWRLRKLIVGLGGAQVLFTTSVLMAIGLMIGFDWRPTLTVSMALSLSSTALVLQMLQEKNLLKTAEGETSFAVLLFQDIAVIPILIIIPLLAQHGNIQLNLHEATFFMQLPRWLYAIFVAGVIGSVILIGHYLSRHLFLIIAKTNLREVFTAFSLALVVGVTLLMESIGVSPALGAFIAGVVLANSQYKHAVDADIQPFKGILLGLFFISVGMTMNFSLFSEKTMLILITVFALITLKAVVLYFLGFLFDLSKLQAVGFAFALSQGSEFAFVLFEYAGKIKVINPEYEAFFTLVVGLSMLATPFLILLYKRFIIPKFMSFLPEREYDSINEKMGLFWQVMDVLGKLLDVCLMVKI